MDANVLGLIPARGGSKRVPRKNIKVLGDKPLMAWTIETALSSAYLNNVVVSSEDDEILDIAATFGAETLKRPKKLSTDKADSYGVMLHALEHYAPDYLCLLQPTSPFRTPHDIMWPIVRSVINQVPVVTTCDKKTANGAVYVAPVRWLKNGGNFDRDRVRWFVMDPARSLDIDTPEDWEIASKMVKKK
jgi:CMP-N,N'-diacetyllegionaminic acid synthase